MDAMTIGAQHSTLGNFGHKVFPSPRDGAANGEGFRGRVDMVKVEGSGMLGIPAHFASSFHFDGVDLLPAFQASRLLVRPHTVGAIGGGSAVGGKAALASMRATTAKATREALERVAKGTVELPVIEFIAANGTATVSITYYG